MIPIIGNLMLLGAATALFLGTIHLNWLRR